jgi:hypothetical protein
MEKGIKLALSGMILLCCFLELNGQVYYTRDANISFYSEAPLEKIEAHNYNGSSVINLENGQIEFGVLINAFQFKKALMQQHFNENYMESDQYPKATFKGTFTGFTSVNLTKEENYPVEIQGIMTIHGQSKALNISGTFKPNQQSISATSTFDLNVADFDIKIPKIVREKIAKTVTVNVDLIYLPMETN